MTSSRELEELLSVVNGAVLNQPCSDDHLVELALGLTDWKEVALFLKLSETEIEEVEERVRDGLVRAKNLRMLRKWRAKYGDQATYSTLSTTLWKLGRRSVIEEMIQLLQAPPDPHQVMSGPPSRVAIYADYLKFRYSADMPGFISHFPRPPTHVYFDLVLIEREEKEDPSEGKELALLSTQGRVQEILEKRTLIKLEELFSLDKKCRKVILIEGSPGSGKTTLAWHICQEWEKGEPFPDFVLVIFVQLRDPAIQSAQSIADLLPHRNDRMAQEVVAEIEARDGEGVLFVLDGWDEFPGSPPPESPLRQLIQPPVHSPLQRSTIMITSRPEASAELHDLASSRVHVVGFTPEKVEEYIKESLNPQDAQALVKQVKDNPAIEGSCSLPLIATIIVTLFLRMGHQLPSTVTGIFEALVLYCILRHCKAKAGLSIRSLSSLDSLPVELQQSFDSLCSLAFQGVLNNKILFTEEEINVIPCNFATLSLLQAVESFVAVGSAKTYSFLHLSVQELLAAWRVSKMPVEVQSDAIDKLHRCERFPGVFRFYAGLTHLSAPWSKDFIKQMIDSSSHDGKKIFTTWEMNLVLECLHEAQGPSIYRLVGDQLNLSALYLNDTLSAVACHSLGYLLPLAMPASTFLFLNEQCTIFLTKGLQKGWSEQQRLRDRLKIEITTVLSTPAGVQAVSQLVSSCGVRYLRLNLGVSPPLNWYQVLERIVAELTYDHPLEALAIHGRFHSTTVSSKTSIVNWYNVLTKNSRLKALEINFRYVEVITDISSIAIGLQQNSTLKHLGLRKVTNKVVNYLASALSRNTSLETLDLADNLITNEGVKCLVTALAKNTSLKTLDLQHNCITDIGVWFLAEPLIENTTSLKALNVSHNNITSVSATCLAEVLKRNTTLKSLNVSNSNISGAGVGLLAGALKHNRTMESLQLDLHPDVLEPLAHSLIVNRNVKIHDQTGSQYWCDCLPPPGLAEKLMANGVLQQLLTIAIEQTLIEFGPELTKVALIAVAEEWKEKAGY